MQTRATLSTLLIGLVLLAGCGDNQNPTAATYANLPVAASNQGIPTRAEEHPQGWTTLSHSALWQRLAETDSTAIVGLRAPGAPRGVWRNQLLLTHSEWTEAHKSVVSQCARRWASPGS
jgi:hypothetical protein